MRILYFHQHFSTPKGSNGTRSYEFSKALIARGHSVTMICGENDRSGLLLEKDKAKNWSRGLVDGIDVIALPLRYSNHHSLPRRSLIFLNFAIRSIAISMSEEYDLVFASSTPLTAGIPGIVVKLFRGKIPFIFEVRDLWPELPRALGFKNPILLAGMGFLEWLTYSVADRCIALAPGIENGIRRRAPIGKEIVIIPNGCDNHLFSPKLRSELSLSDLNAGAFIAGFTGAHGIANGIDVVIDAAIELQRRNRSDIQIVLIGDGNQKERLIGRSKNANLKNIFFYPPVQKIDLAQITASFDCGLMILADIPAFYNGTSPNKFFDYIASGIPVVCNYPGWISELIKSNCCGLVVSPRDPSALADALIRLADDPKCGKEMGLRARRLAEKQFDRCKLAERFVEVIER